MTRRYTHIKALEKEIMEMKEAGKTHREIAEHYGFKDKYVVKEFLKRRKRRDRLLEAGVEPRRKGYQPSEKEKDSEIKRLKMENELLRDFLRLAGMTNTSFSIIMNVFN